MHYRLAPGVTFCFCADRAVVLKRLADRYLGLTAAQAGALRALGEETAPTIEPVVLTGLVSAGVLAMTTTPAGPVAPCVHTAPARSVLEDPARTKPSLGDLVLTAGTLLALSIAMRIRPFHRVLDGVERARAAHGARPGSDPVAVNACVRRYLSARRFAPVNAACLLDSLALLVFLARHGLHAQLVIAVDTRPFEAHAWAQAGDWALNESVLRASMLTPILVL